MTSDKKLTIKQAAFVKAYLQLGNASEAYRIAYPVARKWTDTAVRVQASRMLDNPSIVLTLDAVAERNEITRDRIIQEYALLAFSDMRHYLRFDADGRAYLDWGAMPPEATKAISEITQDVYTEGRGDDAKDARRTKFKLHDKGRALDSLAKLMGFMVERIESKELKVNVDAVAWLKAGYTPEELRHMLQSGRGDNRNDAMSDNRYPELQGGDE